MIGSRLADWFGLAFVIGILYILVRPRSQAAQFVDAVADLLIALVRSAGQLAAT